MKPRFSRQTQSPGVGTILLLPVLLAFSFTSLCGEEWTEVKDARGRSLTVKIQKVEGEQVTFSTRDGKTYTYPLAKFSLTDQLTLRQWKPSVTGANPVKEDSKLEKISSSDSETVFRTEHFEFQIMGKEADVEASQVEAIAPVFEAAHWAFLSQLPISLQPQPAASHFKVRLYLSEKEFEISSKETLGAEQPIVYNLSLDLLIGPIERLKPSAALVREIAFALLGQRLTTMPPWLAAAVAEYVAAAPYKDHQLTLADPLVNLRNHLAEAYGLSDKTMPMLEPSRVLSLDYAALRSEGLTGNQSRSSALLLFHYFAHLDREENGLRNYLLAIQTQTPADEATAALIGGREPERLQDDIKVAFVPTQLRIAFVQ